MVGEVNLGTAELIRRYGVMHPAFGALRGEEISTLTPNPHCSLGTYLFVDQHKKATPVTRFLDVGAFLQDLDVQSRSAHRTIVKYFSAVKTWQSLKRHPAATPSTSSNAVETPSLDDSREPSPGSFRRPRHGEDSRSLFLAPVLEAAMADIQEFLKTMIDKGASDLHITVGSPPLIRINGELTPLPYPPLTAPDTKNLCYSLLTEGQKKRFEEESELDFSFGIRGVARFRGNLYNQKGCVGGAFRTIPHQTPQLHQLGLPPSVIDMTKLPRGLVLVTGPTGSGKSTTLAAMIEHLNENFKRHIVTLEDPIEYMFEDNQCVIEQREIGLDTMTFHTGLKAVLRQDPDVIMVGEMRDSLSMQAAITTSTQADMRPWDYLFVDQPSGCINLGNSVTITVSGALPTTYLGLYTVALRSAMGEKT